MGGTREGETKCTAPRGSPGPKGRGARPASQHHSSGCTRALIRDPAGRPEGRKRWNRWDSGLGGRHLGIRRQPSSVQAASSTWIWWDTFTSPWLHGKNRKVLAVRSPSQTLCSNDADASTAARSTSYLAELCSSPATLGWRWRHRHSCTRAGEHGPQHFGTYCACACQRSWLDSGSPPPATLWPGRVLAVSPGICVALSSKSCTVVAADDLYRIMSFRCTIDCVM